MLLLSPSIEANSCLVQVDVVSELLLALGRVLAFDRLIVVVVDGFRPLAAECARLLVAVAVAEAREYLSFFFKKRRDAKIVQIVVELAIHGKVSEEAAWK